MSSINAPRVSLLLLICWVSAWVPLHAQWQAQTLVLQPGWNPVYLSISPTPSDCDSVFGGNPRILSVRRWAPPPIEAVLYDEVTGATIPQSGSWLTWFPPNHADRPLLNLTEFQSGAYLIEVSSGPQVSLSLQGRPLVLSYAWQPGSHHFLGLPVYGPAVSFSTFFAAASNDIRIDSPGRGRGLPDPV
jgi:hypothetical protein